jgi:voltage-gated potassium channel
VGYGDTYPITVGGRIFTFVILMIGLGVISIPAGLLASALSKARQMEHEAGLDQDEAVLLEELKEMEGL